MMTNAKCEIKANSAPLKEIRKARLEARFTQKQAATIVGATRDAWSAWELGRNNMPIHLFEEFLKLTASIRHPLPPAPSPKDIRAARKAAGLTLKEAGALVGVTGPEWSHYEQERTDMHPDLWARFRECMIKSDSALEIVAVTSITQQGVHLALKDEMYFLAFKDFPWFRDAAIGKVLQVEMPSPGHLHWPALDIDLAVESIRDPNSFPLVSMEHRSPPRST